MKKDLFSNNWFVGIVSLFFALLLFVSVSNESNAFSSVVQSNNSASIESSVTISNVPVHLGAHDEGTFISGMPETVSVRLSGPKNIISQLSVENFKVMTESLKGIEAGVKAIRFVVEGLPEKVEYKVTPDLFYGTISTKETVVKPLEYVIGENLVASGYEVIDIAMAFEEVTLSGATDEINKIERVIVAIQQDRPQTATFEEFYRIQILDSQGKPLDINASETEVKVTVTIAPKEGQKSLIIIPVGENENYNYQYAFINASSVSVSGAQVDSVDTVKLLVDVSHLNASGVVTGIVENIDGLSITPSQVDVQVTVVPLSNESSQTSEIEEIETTAEESATETTEMEE